jgi:hypothetical protein
MRTLELLVEALATASALPGALSLTVDAVVGVILSVASAASGLATVGGGRRRRLAIAACVHFVGSLDGAQLRPSWWVHVQDLRHQLRAGVEVRRGVA